MMTLGYSLIRVRVAERRVVEWSSGSHGYMDTGYYSDEIVEAIRSNK